MSNRTTASESATIVGRSMEQVLDRRHAYEATLDKIDNAIADGDTRPTADLLTALKRNFEYEVGAALGRDDLMCSLAMAAFDDANSRRCICCSLPFASRGTDNVVCDPCRANAPEFDQSGRSA